MIIAAPKLRQSQYCRPNDSISATTSSVRRRSFENLSASSSMTGPIDRAFAIIASVSVGGRSCMLAPGLIKTDGAHANSGRKAAARDRVVESRALQRDGYPSDLIGALIFLASEDSDFITGQTIAVDGGSINT